MRKLQLPLFFFILLILTRFNIDTDFGWHLAIGREFVETGSIIRGDIFSWTMPGYVWGNSYFLYQILLAFLFKNAGYVVLSVLFGLVGSVAVAVLIKKIDFVKALAVLAGVGAAAGTLGVRPHTISFLFFSALIVLLEKNFFGKRIHILISFLFFALWANIHRGFLIGLLVAGAYFAVDWLYKRSLGRKRPVLVPALCLAAGVLGSLATPFSIFAWNSGIVGDIRSFENWNYIAEWQPVLFFYPSNVFFVITGIIFIYILLRSDKGSNPFWLITSAVFFAVSFLSAAFLFFWAALYIFIVCRYLDLDSDKYKMIKIPFYFLSYVSLFILTVTLVKYLGPYDLDGLGRNGKYPVDAIKFLEKENLRGGLFNEFAWGGYIDWQLRAPVFIDGRMTSWQRTDGTGVLADYIGITYDRKCGILSKYDVKTVLVARDTDTGCFESFKEVYRDSVARVLIRDQ